MIDFTRLDDVRAKRPLIHCVSNIVSAGDCANLVLAAGASPIMAQCAEEMDAITRASHATVLNTGTPDNEKYRVCLLCGQEAAALGQPVVLDPVGVGSSRWRLQSVQALLHIFTPAILRVNLGEAQALTQRDSRELGVDTPVPGSPAECRETAMTLARQRRTAVLLSGPEDLLSNGTSLWRVTGGSSLMASVTGTGCMLSVLCGVFSAVEPDALYAAVLASAFWKVCSKRAEQAAGGRGPGSFRAALMDAAWALTTQDFSSEAQIELLES